jgi:DNA-binding GntR family transcriptional regulator
LTAAAAVQRKPRYRVLADELRRQVLDNAFAADQFPTEAELCQAHGVSRFTVREALRALQAEGLIKRRRGSGTTVQPASARGGALHQPLSNVGEILQYAHDTRIVFERLSAAPLPKALADEIGAAAVAGSWSRFTGIRTGGAADNRPIALTQAYLHPHLADAAARIDIAGTTLFRQMEELGGVRIARVTQDIQAVPASAEVARALGIGRRAPALRILRCYYDAGERLLEISASHHPGDRFAYSMHIEADGA